MANDRLGGGEPPAGDHLQSVYRFWLVGHQLEHGAAPWKDPYSFQPLVEPQTVLGGWPFGFAFWPIEAAFGPVVAWNLLLLGTIVAAGLLTYGWLRSLALAGAPAAVGGLGFAIAPYRLEQSAGHLLGWIAVFIPLALLAIERARVAENRRAAHAWGALAALAVTSIALGGQLHLALGAAPFLLAYAAIRFERLAFAWTAAGTLAAAGIGVAIRYTLIAGSPEESGRSVEEVRRYSAEWVDFVNRWHAPRSEEFAYLGWLVPVLAVAGVVVMARRQRGLAILLGLGAAVPVLLALGTNLSIYAPVWRHFPPLHFTRVPERLLPIADLALAALAAIAVAELLRRVGTRGAALAGVLFVLVALDLVVQPLSATAADPGNAAYRTLAQAPSGRVLELPLFEPGVHYGSVYDYYQLQEARQQPGGYSTLAPQEAFDFYFSHNRLNCGVWLPGDTAELARLGITRILFHRGLYAQAHRRGASFARWGLVLNEWRPAAVGGRVWLFEPGSVQSRPPFDVAIPREPYLCSGWRGQTMIGRQATIWVYGSGTLELDLRIAGSVAVRLWVDGRRADLRRWKRADFVRGPLGDLGWHAVLLSASRRGVELHAVSARR
jgi:hypothetical protein